MGWLDLLASLPSAPRPGLNWPDLPLEGLPGLPASGPPSCENPPPGDDDDEDESGNENPPWTPDRDHSDPDDGPPAEPEKDHSDPDDQPAYTEDQPWTPDRDHSLPGDQPPEEYQERERQQETQQREEQQQREQERREQERREQERQEQKQREKEERRENKRRERASESYTERSDVRDGLEEYAKWMNEGTTAERFLKLIPSLVIVPLGAVLNCAEETFRRPVPGVTGPSATEVMRRQRKKRGK